MEDKRQYETCSKRYILWGKNRHIFEFQYMFDDLLNIVGYTQFDKDQKYEYTLKGRAVYLEELNNSFADCDIIVCDSEVEEYKNYTSFCSTLEGRITLCENFFKLLDPLDDGLISRRKLGIWGTGATEIDLYEKYNQFGYINQYPIDFYVDSNEDKCGSKYRGRLVQLPEKLNHKSDFIIVASIYYKDIKVKLEEMGFVEKVDFIPYTYVMTRPSLMMKEQMRTERIYNFRCLQPFTLCDYAWYGVYACCWTKYPIGNPASDTPQESWHSNVAKLIRLSALTKSYCFCKSEQCGRWGVDDTGELGDYDVPKTLLSGLDDSCNLFCKSCRDKVRVTQGASRDIRMYFADRLIDSGWLERVGTLFISGRGEALASVVDRKIIFGFIGERKCIDIITNLTMWDERKLDELSMKYGTIRFHCSVDAMTKDTYEKMRRGGNWDKVVKNLHVLSEYRRKGTIKFLELRMIISSRNYSEVKSFVNFAKSIGADRVYLMKMLKIYCWNDKQWNDYFQESMFTLDDKPSERLKELLKDPIMKDEIVIHDFAMYM